ncbi:hypothetical protein AHAS_Ahas14G0107700 [Arachis hypogaea]
MVDFYIIKLAWFSSSISMIIFLEIKSKRNWKTMLQTLKGYPTCIYLYHLATILT